MSLKQWSMQGRYGLRSFESEQVARIALDRWLLIVARHVGL
jgi:hypothetical protein